MRFGTVDPSSEMSDFLLQSGGYAVIDGGLATELERHGADLNDPLWSAKCLISSPHLIRAVHLDYLEAGADIIITASYQATIQGFMAKGLSSEESEALLRKSVEIACEARDIYNQKCKESLTDGARNERILKQHPILVAASVGSYGAYLADGSEYNGNYGKAITLETLKEFHRRRVQVLAESGADLIAFETIPNKLEAQAFVELLEEGNISIPAWFAFNSKDGINVVSGDSVFDCVTVANSCKKVVAVGINCTPPRFIHGLILSIQKVTTKPILIYPNSGETYDPGCKQWVLNMDWFPPAEASLKRSFIQKLIYELVEHDSQKTGPDACSDECYPSCSMEKDNENGSEFHLDRQSLAKGSHGFSCSAADQGIETKLLTESSSRSQFASESSLILRELLEPGPTAGSFPNEQVRTQDQISSFHSFKNVTLPVKEEEESDEQFAFTPSGGVVSPSPIGISSSACRTSYASKSFTIVDRINLDTMREDKHCGNFLSPEASFGSQNSSEARVDEHLSLGGFGCPDVQEKKEEPRSASQENIGCVTGSPASVSSDRLENSIVEDSQVVAGLTENEGKKDHCIVEDSQEVAGLTENEDKKDHYIVEDSQEMVGLTENEDKKGHCIVQDSQEVGGLTEDGDKKRKDCHEDFLASFHNPTGSRETKNHMDGHVQLGSEGLLSGPEQQATKRQRLAPEGERQYRRSVSKDCHS